MKAAEKLRTRKFAVAFIVLIIVSLVLATAVPQRTAMSDAEYFGFSVRYPGLSKFISLAGLDHVYTTWWFLGTVLLFSLNIALNLSERVKITLTQFREEDALVPGRFGKPPFCHEFPHPGVISETVKQKLVTVFEDKGYRVKTQPEGISAYRGRYGLWSVPLFHASMLVVLAGILISGLSKFSGSFELSEGQAFNGKKEEFVRRSYGLLQLEPEFGFSLLLKKYHTEYWDNDQPRLYQSSVDVVEGGSPAFSKNIEVNEPLRYKGYSFYQSKYHGYSAFLSLRGRHTGSEVTGYVNFPYRERYPGILSKDFAIPQTELRARLRFDVAYPDIMAVTVLSGNTPVWDGALPKGGGIDLGEFNLIFNGVVWWTGMYVSRDWGVPVVYAGFALLTLSLFAVIFVVPKTVSVFYSGDRILIGGKSLRDRGVFQEEFENIALSIKRFFDE